MPAINPFAPAPAPPEQPTSATRAGLRPVGRPHKHMEDQGELLLLSSYLIKKGLISPLLTAKQEVQMKSNNGSPVDLIGELEPWLCLLEQFQNSNLFISKTNTPNRSVALEESQGARSEPGLIDDT